ncbi:MAG: hypothetical protein IJO79_06870 [Firmicutes bacterium]|nr:hypothetical protein [Bacillota bacterium]
MKVTVVTSVMFSFQENDVAFAMMYLLRKSDVSNQSLPLEGKVSPKVTDEVEKQA